MTLGQELPLNGSPWKATQEPLKVPNVGVELALANSYFPSPWRVTPRAPSVHALSLHQTGYNLDIFVPCALYDC